MAKVFILKQGDDGVGQALRVPGVYQKRLLPVVHDLRETTHPSDHGGSAKGHGLDESDGQPFVHGREREYVKGAREPRSVLASPGEDDRPLESEIADPPANV